MSVLLRVVNFGVRHGTHAAVHDVTLDVQCGEVLAILGPNAAGKTTLLRGLAGLLDPTGGSVERHVEPFEIAYLAQSEPLPAEWTALEVVKLGRAPRLGSWRRLGDADERATRSAMRITRTLDLANRRIATLSGGQRQRVALARALAQEPRILLLDEPTTHLDLRHQLDVIALLRSESRRGVTSVAVVHDLALAGHADRCAVLSHGRLVALGAPKDVLRPALIREVFGAAVDVLPGRDGRIVVVASLDGLGVEDREEAWATTPSF